MRWHAVSVAAVAFAAARAAVSEPPASSRLCSASNLAAECWACAVAAAATCAAGATVAAVRAGSGRVLHEGVVPCLLLGRRDVRQSVLCRTDVLSGDRGRCGVRWDTVSIAAASVATCASVAAAASPPGWFFKASVVASVC